MQNFGIFVEAFVFLFQKRSGADENAQINFLVLDGGYLCNVIDLLTWIEVNIAETSYVGLHRFCKMSRQMPPSAYTLGWNMWLTNRTVGGLLGYSSVNSIVSLKVPSSNGVSCGPKMTAFHIIMLLSVGAPLTPVGGSSCNLRTRQNTHFTLKLAQSGRKATATVRIWGNWWLRTVWNLSWGVVGLELTFYYKIN